MDVKKWVRSLFLAAALYDGIIGILFLMVPLQLFKTFNVTPPNHVGYVQFPGMLLIVFAIMFFNIAKAPAGNINLIIYGILLKISYCSVVFSHWIVGNIPSLWVPFAFFDLAFLIAFIFAYKAYR